MNNRMTKIQNQHKMQRYSTTYIIILYKYIYTAITSLYKGTCFADKCIGLLVPINVEHLKIYINAIDVLLES